MQGPGRCQALSYSTFKDDWEVLPGRFSVEALAALASWLREVMVSKMDMASLATFALGPGAGTPWRERHVLE